MMKLSSFFNDVVRGDRNDIFDPPTSKNGKQEDQKGYGDDNSICRLMLEAHTKYPHLARIGLEKMRLHHRLEVVQNLEDNQRKNVLRSIQSDIGENDLQVDTASKLSLDELKAVYAYVKNAQLVRVANPHLFQESSAYDPGTPFYEHYKIDFPSFSELHKVLSLWGCESGESESETNIGEILAGRIFRLMDTNVDGLLNFKELVQILEILCKADHVKKLKLLLLEIKYTSYEIVTYMNYHIHIAYWLYKVILGIDKLIYTKLSYVLLNSWLSFIPKKQ